jgi:16S rRNA (cytosine967-C5)-methyltransferase
VGIRRDGERPRGGRTRKTEGAAARDAAVALLAGVLDEKRPLDALLDPETGIGAFLGLSARDRALARAITGMALRRRGQVAAALAGLIERPLPAKSGRLRRILEIGATQILFLDVPDYAAVSLAVGQAERDADARHFKGLVNGVLRRLAREREEILARQDPMALNTPDWLFTRWSARYGAAAARAIAGAHLVEPALDLTVRRDPEGWAVRLGGIVLPNGTVRLPAKGPIDALPGFEEGAWWVQDAAATLPARLLGDVKGRSVADLCAAPGGKTMQLAAAGARVTAVDQSEPRMERLKRNLARAGLPAEAATADVLTFDGGQRFDAVLLDAPCSATGTIRRHPDVAWLRKPDDIASLAQLQTKLLARAVELTKPGGLVVFSTCSLEPEEGEEQARHALATLPVAAAPVGAEETAGLGSISPEGWVRTLPCDLPGDDPRLAGLSGFFIARLRRM